MRTILYSVVVGLMLLGGSAAGAQRPGAGAVVDSAMSPLAWLAGEWKGTGTMQTRAGTEVGAVHETVQARLGGRVLIMEGIGRDPAGGDTGRVVHHAFGVLSYDPEKRRYVFRAFRDGGVIDPEGRIEDGVFIWEFTVPGGGRTRYRISQDDGAWLETGEYSSDGTSWRKFFEMRLRRVGASR